MWCLVFTEALFCLAVLLHCSVLKSVPSFTAQHLGSRALVSVSQEVRDMNVLITEQGNSNEHRTQYTHGSIFQNIKKDTLHLCKYLD